MDCYTFLMSAGPHFPKFHPADKEHVLKVYHMVVTLISETAAQNVFVFIQWVIFFFQCKMFTLLFDPLCNFLYIVFLWNCKCCVYVMDVMQGATTNRLGTEQAKICP